MPLTSLLREAGSPLRSLFNECLPQTSSFVAALNRDLRALPLNTPTPADAGLSGTAIDYRLRYYFAVPEIEDTIAWLGADKLEAAILDYPESPLRDTVNEFIRALQRDIVALQPIGVRLSAADEARLSRICVVLAYFEQFFRSGRSALLIGMEDGSLRSGADILQLPRSGVIEDVATMAAAFFDSQYPLLASRAVVLNPTFAGSLDVGGADADIIAGDSLIEFKSGATDGPIKGWAVYQLLGYACLDYSDRYRIRKVGFSVLRRNALREWDIEDLVRRLSAGQLGYDSLRAQVRAFAMGRPT